MTRVDAWIRPHLRSVTPYVAARDAYRGDALLLLDANENPWGPPASSLPPELGRYPDPRCGSLRDALAAWLKTAPEQLWIGNGADSAIDLVLRVFVDPGEPVVVASPTYSLYAIAARAHGAAVREVPLDERFDLDLDALKPALERAKLVFLCSPNNPTGNRLSVGRIEALVRAHDGPVVVDEAYVEFSRGPSLVGRVPALPNLIVLRTMSKAWGLAGARLGYLVADPGVVEALDRVDLSYPLSILSIRAACAALARRDVMADRVRRIVWERDRLARCLRAMGLSPLPSEANFVLVRAPDAAQVQRRLAEEHGIVVRYLGDLPGVGPSLRITAGRPEDTERVCAALEEVRA